MRRYGMRFIGAAIVLAACVAHAEPQLASDQAPVQLATGTCPVRLIGHEPGVVAGIMKERKLREITLERIVLPADVGAGAVAPNLMITVKLGERSVRGIYSNIAGDGCIASDIRHGVDAHGNLYQFDGPPGVVDYTAGRCHTARGWQPCNLRGVRNVLFVVRDPKLELAGVIGSDLKLYPTTAARSRTELARPQ